MTHPTDPDETDRDPRPGVARMALAAAGWGLAGAVWFGGLWAGLVVAWEHLLGVNIARLPPDQNPQDAALRLAVLGGLLGCVVAGTAAIAYRRALAVVLWGIGAGLATAAATAVGVHAAVEFRGVLPPELSSALGFAAAGLLGGVAACVWSRKNAEPAEDEEEPGQTPGAGAAAVGTGRARSGFAWPVLRLLPALTLSVSSLVVAALTAPSGAALALLAVGLLGLSVVPILWGQERRFRELERRFRGGRNA